MANKIIKYNLTGAGTIPTYIDDGGYYPKANSNASPQDWDLIGATVEGSSETGLGELANKAAIVTIQIPTQVTGKNEMLMMKKLLLTKTQQLHIFGLKKHNNIKGILNG